MTRRGQGVLDAPEERYVSETKGPRRVKGAVRRESQEDFAQDFDQEFGGQRFGEDGFADGEDFDSGPRGGRAGGEVRRRGGVQKKEGLLARLPRTVWGRVGAGVSAVVVLGVCALGVMAVRNAALHDARFVIPTSAAIRVEGNRHVTKAQLLSIFGGDVERNIFTVSLAERRAELERLPWVEHATVMRLLPDRVRVSIVERTPVAFVRQGNRIGLVDKGGVLMDLMAGAGEHYSFPVVTGITADEPLSTRAARMKIFERFITELDAGGGRISEGLSEVDLSSPEDVKALIPDDLGGDKHGEMLVHFGDSDFLERYNKYKAHLGEWRVQYPNLASVDMRYDRQAVLEMKAGSTVPVSGTGPGADAAKVVPAVAVHAPAAAVPHATVVPVAHGAGAPKPATIAGSTAVAKTGSNGAGKSAGAGVAAAAPSAAAGPVQSSAQSSAQGSAPSKGGDVVVHHLMVAKDVPANKTAPNKTAVKKPVAKKPAAKTTTAKAAATQSHPPAVAQ